MSLCGQVGARVRLQTPWQFLAVRLLPLLVPSVSWFCPIMLCVIFPCRELSWIPLQSAAHEDEAVDGNGPRGALQADRVCSSS